MGSSKPSGPSAAELELQRQQQEELERQRQEAERKKAEAAAMRKAMTASGLAVMSAEESAKGAYGSVLGV